MTVVHNSRLCALGVVAQAGLCQTEGRSPGVSSSAILAALWMEHTEHTRRLATLMGMDCWMSSGLGDNTFIATADQTSVHVVEDNNSTQYAGGSGFAPGQNFRGQGMLTKQLFADIILKAGHQTTSDSFYGTIALLP
jgi:hypothetical protein